MIKNTEPEPRLLLESNAYIYKPQRIPFRFNGCDDSQSKSLHCAVRKFLIVIQKHLLPYPDFLVYGYNIKEELKILKSSFKSLLTSDYKSRQKLVQTLPKLMKQVIVYPSHFALDRLLLIDPIDPKEKETKIIPMNESFTNIDGMTILHAYVFVYKQNQVRIKSILESESKLYKKNMWKSE